MLDYILFGTGERVELRDAVDLVPKKFHTDGKLSLIHIFVPKDRFLQWITDSVNG